MSIKKSIRTGYSSSVSKVAVQVTCFKKKCCNKSINCFFLRDIFFSPKSVIFWLITQTILNYTVEKWFISIWRKDPLVQIGLFFWGCCCCWYFYFAALSWILKLHRNLNHAFSAPHSGQEWQGVNIQIYFLPWQFSGLGLSLLLCAGSPK